MGAFRLKVWAPSMEEELASSFTFREKCNKTQNPCYLVMKATDILKKILVELTGKIKLEQQTLENGTILEADAFAAGNEIFIVSGEDRIALPVGEYALADGRVVVVTEEGVISEVKSNDTDTPEGQVVEAEEEEVVVEVPEEVAPAVTEIIEAVVEVVAPLIEEVKTEMEKLRQEMGKYKEKMSAQPAAKPIKRNPEAQSKPQGFQIAANRQSNTLDRVLSKLK